MLAYSNFVRICSDKGYTPSAAALAAGVSKSTISKWKANPNSLPTSRTIAKLAGFLGVSISEFLCEPDPAEEKKEETKKESPLPNSGSELSEAQRNMIERILKLTDDQLELLDRLADAALDR